MVVQTVNALRSVSLKSLTVLAFHLKADDVIVDGVVERIVQCGNVDEGVGCFGVFVNAPSQADVAFEILAESIVVRTARQIGVTVNRVGGKR